MNIIGIDIGGTKCTTILGRINSNGQPEVIEKKIILTKDYSNPYEMISQMQVRIDSLLKDNHLEVKDIASIGISCGGPLDSKTGMVLSPPNLPGWDRIPVVKMFRDKYHITTAIQNDANACALAEWKFGAGRGAQNMIFMTFGTGLGAGLILDGRLYAGTNDNAGEIGHMRLSDFGPVGYGKSGSFEGFCSGGGIAQMGKIKAMEKLQMGLPVGFCKSMSDLDSITAHSIATAAEDGDPLALEVYRISGIYLGKGLSIIIDILNPEVIVIGSIYQRSGSLLQSSMDEIIKLEALSLSRNVCRIAAAELGYSLGDFAALSVAHYAITNSN